VYILKVKENIYLYNNEGQTFLRWPSTRSKEWWKRLFARLGIRVILIDMLWWGGSKRTLLLNLKIRKKWFGLSMQWWLDIALNLFFFVTFIFLSHKQIPLPSLFSFYSFVKAATAIESLGKGSHHIYYEHVRVRPLFGALCYYWYTFVTLLVGSWDLTMK
jgi:hypothetical protein